MHNNSSKKIEKRTGEFSRAEKFNRNSDQEENVMGLDELESHEFKSTRAHKLRREGVEYKLRMIPGSNGQMELVEVQPRPNEFSEWARLMQLTGWHI